MKINQIIRENFKNIDVEYQPNDYVLDQIEIPLEEYLKIRKRFQADVNHDYVLMKLDADNRKTSQAELGSFVNVLELHTTPDWDKSVSAKFQDGHYESILIYPSKDKQAELAVIHTNNSIQLRLVFPTYEWYSNKIAIFKKDKNIS